MPPLGRSCSTMMKKISSKLTAIPSPLKALPPGQTTQPKCGRIAARKSRANGAIPSVSAQGANPSQWPQNSPSPRILKMRPSVPPAGAPLMQVSVTGRERTITIIPCSAPTVPTAVIMATSILCFRILQLQMTTMTIRMLNSLSGRITLIRKTMARVQS